MKIAIFYKVRLTLHWLPMSIFEFRNFFFYMFMIKKKCLTAYICFTIHQSAYYNSNLWKKYFWPHTLHPLCNLGLKPFSLVIQWIPLSCQNLCQTIKLSILIGGIMKREVSLFIQWIGCLNQIVYQTTKYQICLLIGKSDWLKTLGENVEVAWSKMWRHGQIQFRTQKFENW